MDYILHLIIILFLSGVLILSLNYVAGFGGILSVNHISFYGIGAYSTAILMINYGFPFIGACFLAVLITGLIAFAASFPILKLKGDSLVLISLGFAIIVYSVLLNWRGLTAGGMGIAQIPSPEIFGFIFDTKQSFIWLAGFAFISTFLILWWITRSVYGIIMKSIREEETKAMTVGHHAQVYKRSIFVFSSLFAGLAGSLFATYATVIEPKSFKLMPSIILLIMVILGGLGSLRGAVLGALFMILIPEALRFLSLPTTIMAQVQQIIYGSLVVILMFWRPQGLLGEYKI